MSIKNKVVEVLQSFFGITRSGANTVVMPASGGLFAVRQPPGGSGTILGIQVSDGTTRFYFSDVSYTFIVNDAVYISGVDGSITTLAGADVRASSFTAFTITNPTLRWPNGSADVSLYRIAAGAIGPGSGGASGAGDFSLTKSLLTAGTLTQTSSALSRTAWHRYSWTNAMITALGASPTGDIAVCTLPAKTRVLRALIVVDASATFADTLVASVGTNGANYDNYVIDGSIKAAANTVYGDAANGSETGAGLFSTFFIDHIPSFTGTTLVNLHVDGNATNLSGVTGSAGSVYLLTETMP